MSQFPVTALSGVGHRFSPDATNPSFLAFLDCLNIRVTGVAEEFAMLSDAQKRHACSRGVFFRELSSPGSHSFINFRDDDERAAGLQDSQHFAHVAEQVRPSELPEFEVESWI
jgi:hypothetical protein